MTVFVPGPLTNPLNGSHGHWSKHRKWAEDWRERTHHHLWLALRTQLPRVNAVRMDAAYAARPKVVRFLAKTGNSVDDDNLRAMLKPCRDALKDARIIHDDAKHSGHTFLYDQVIDRAERGVLITWDEAPERPMWTATAPSIPPSSRWT